MTDGPTTEVERLFRGWSARVRRSRRVILSVAGLAAVGLATYAARTLGVNTDTSSLVSDRLEWRQRAVAYERAFPWNDGGLTILVEAGTREVAADAAGKLTRVLVEDTAMFESVYRPDGGPFFDEHGLLFRDVDTLASLSRRAVDAAALLSELGRAPTLGGLANALASATDPPLRSLPEPGVDLAPVLSLLAATTFAASEGRVRSMPWSAVLEGRLPTSQERRQTIIAHPRLAFDNRVPGRDAMSRVRRAASDLGLDGRHGIAVRLTGPVAIEAEELETAFDGVRRAGLLAVVSVALILFFALRSARLIAASLLTLVIGLIGTSAFAAAAIGQLNLISVAFAVLYVGLGIDYALHLSLRYRAHLGRGEPVGPSLDAAVGEVGPALALSALTTAGCFYAFTLTDFTGLAELGVIGGTGMLISFVVTLTVLPAALSAWPHPRVDPLPDGLPRLGSFVRRHRRAILLATAGTAAVAAMAVPGVTFDENALNLRDPDSESVTAYRELLADSLARPLTVSVVSADDAAFDGLIARVGALPEVSGTRALDAFVPDFQQAKRRHIRRVADVLGPEPSPASSTSEADDIDALLASIVRLRWVGSPAERTAARQAYHALRAWQRAVETLSVEERGVRVASLTTALVGPLPVLFSSVRRAAAGSELTAVDLPRDLRARWVGSSGERRVEVVPSGMLGETDELRSFVDAVSGIEPSATGDAVTQIETGRVAVSAFRRAFLAAGAVTMLVLLLVLRSFVAAALVVAPLILAGLWTSGLLSGLEIPFNYANVIALPLLLGVGVDNGVHMVHHRRRGRNRAPLAGSTARAILFASLTTIASFGNLAFAEHVGMATMGRLLTVGMICVLAATLVVLPAVLSGRRLGNDEEGTETRPLFDGPVDDSVERA